MCELPIHNVTTKWTEIAFEIHSFFFQQLHEQKSIHTDCFLYQGLNHDMAIELGKYA